MQATILLGSRDGGLGLERKVVVPLDYSIHFDTKLGQAGHKRDKSTLVRNTDERASYVEHACTWGRLLND